MHAPSHTPSIPSQRRSRIVHFGCAMLLAASLSACGFALAGAPVSIKTFALNGEVDNPVAQSFILQNQDIMARSTPSMADVVLDFSPAQITRSILSKNAQGEIVEYRLQMSTTFQGYDTQKKQLIVPTTISTHRVLNMGSGYTASQDSEIERLSQDMANELARSIYHRLRAVDAQRSPAKAP